MKNTELEMTKQLVIHYKAEVAKSEMKIQEIEFQLKKEKKRTMFWEKRTRDLIEGKLLQLEKEKQTFVDKIMELEVQLEEEGKLERTVKITPPPINKDCFYSYFTYTIILPNENDNDSSLSIVGDYYIQNQSDEDVNDLIVCLKISPSNAAHLSGKISAPQLVDKIEEKGAIDWFYALDNWKDKIRNDGEYWIRPSNNPHLLSGSSLVLKGFEIIVSKNTSFSTCKVDAYVYSSNRELPVGVKNRINLHFS
ncbi:hypothetical protein [Sutcliffiella rhizosphaerae]|uniref:Uncharacterized protein n=1 Tax=Sutcliffiella rhizosphaerae TaxID=2880967 RepID=A0ABM8YS42_9BACI|nr:hypothetical protein [Sutcliffiella rhizosphaerae]CAG9622815.1 hypothetical protein BACCIP111883_03606 [Sutcliffiella rhizosphaerae]